MERGQQNDNDDIDSVIHSLGGCGRYQFVITFFGTWLKIVSAMSMMLMAFGNYNPGWKCLDDAANGTDPNLTLASPNGSFDDTNQCQLFHSCDNVEFTPGVHTMVTEWQLLCDKSWISSFIISIQMLGVLIGAYIAGYLGDKIGRKVTMYVATVYHIVVNVIAIFSTSWQMITVMRFLVGLAIPIMMNVPIILAMEFAPHKWRNFLVCFPFWTIGGLIFTFAAMVTEDWRSLHGINAAASFICLVPCYWMPESLRWLVVKEKLGRACNIVKDIAKLNGAKKQDDDRLQRMVNRYKSLTDSNDQSFRNLLTKSVRKPTIIIGIMCISMSIIYYAISFGVKSLPGNLYSNLAILFVSEALMTLISCTLPNYLGRKWSIIAFLATSTALLFCIVGLDLGAQGDLKVIGTLACVMITRATVDAAWDITMTFTGEFFPTVIRSTSVNYASWVARIGGILAPYLIPSDPDTYFINYSIMAVLALVCSCLVAMLPETKGRPLQDTWRSEQPVEVLIDNEHDKQNK